VRAPKSAPLRSNSRAILASTVSRRLAVSTGFAFSGAASAASAGAPAAAVSTAWAPSAARSRVSTAEPPSPQAARPRIPAPTAATITDFLITPSYVETHRRKA
jgi:hypothetical protein